MPPPWYVEKQRKAVEYANSQRAVTRCAFCRWKYTGTVAKGKESFRAHRELRHGAS